jgi:hypothetical protein
MRTSFSVVVGGIFLLLASCDSRKDEEPASPASATRFTADSTNQEQLAHDKREPICLLPQDADAASYLPSGRVKVSIYEVRAPDRLAELVKRMEDSTAKNIEWWRQYRAQHKGTLPYHPNFGISEQEYEEFRRLFEMSIVLQKADEGEIDFQTDSENGTRLATQGSLAPLHGISIRLATNCVETSYGELADHSRIEVSATQHVTGPWQGHQWQRRIGTSDDGKLVTFAVGQHQATGDGILYYNVKSFRSRMPRDEVRLFLHYPLPRQAEKQEGL